MPQLDSVINASPVTTFALHSFTLRHPAPFHGNVHLATERDCAAREGREKRGEREREELVSEK